METLWRHYGDNDEEDGEDNGNPVQDFNNG